MTRRRIRVIIPGAAVPRSQQQERARLRSCRDLASYLTFRKGCIVDVGISGAIVQSGDKRSLRSAATESEG